MAGPATVVLDNEAVQAGTGTGHPKHRRMLAVLEVVAFRNQRRAHSVALVVPTSVRVEAGWDRQDRAAVLLNRLRATDESLGPENTDRATRIRKALDVSVIDAHVGAVMQSSAHPVVVISSDEADIHRIAGWIGAAGVSVIGL